jgi:hypothetical protein
MTDASALQFIPRHPRLQTSDTAIPTDKARCHRPRIQIIDGDVETDVTSGLIPSEAVTVAV